MANGLTLIAGGLVQFATFTRLAFDEVKRELTAIEGKLGITPAVPRRPKVGPTGTCPVAARRSLLRSALKPAVAAARHACCWLRLWR